MSNGKKSLGPFFLTLNVGSSSLKFAVFSRARSDQALLRGELEHGRNRADWLNQVAQQTDEITAGQPWAGVGHRVVHGGSRFVAPTVVNAGILEELRQLIPFAPEHLPGEIELIEQVARQLPGVPQVMCFDTTFHRDLPQVARLLPLPRRFEAVGVRRYGFHGLSYEFLRLELARLGDPAVKKGRVILAHLGNGASLAAMRDGVGVDTSMAFTPSAGLVMGTRTGDLDSGLLAYIAEKEQLTPPQLARLVNHESGLLGLSGSTADMRQLLRQEKTDRHSAEAVELFCYQAKKWLGAFAAVLGGLDSLVFAGGIGEHNPTVRRRICQGMEYLGLEVAESLNESTAVIISPASSRVTVRVIRTDEASIIASAMHRLLP